MTALTNSGESLVAQWLFTTGTPTRPTTWFAALHTADPTEVGNVSEVGAGVGYARQSVSFSEASGVATSTNALTFGPNTTTNWGTISHISVWTLSSAGVALAKGALAASIAIAVGDSLTMAIGALTVTFD